MADSFFFKCSSCGGINRVSPTRLQAGPKCGRCSKPLDTTGRPQEVDDAQLAALIQRSPVPVLVDFWAPWCAPCRMVAPRLEALAQKYAGRLFVAKVDTDRHQQTASALNVRSIPTLGIWKGGSLQRIQPGALGAPQLEAFVAPFLSQP